LLYREKHVLSCSSFRYKMSLVKIISPYVIHMMAPDIILYQEKYIQKFYHVYVSICCVVWYFIDFPITWFSETCVNNKYYFIFFLVFFLISLFPYIFWLPYECKSFANKYSFIHFTWHIFGEQQHHVYYQLFSLHTIYLHCKVICWKTCKYILNTWIFFTSYR